MPKNATPAAGTVGAGLGQTGGRPICPKNTPFPPKSQAEVTKTRMMAHALRYALAGWAVIPLQPNGKAPLTAHGVHDCSTDPETIGEWWERWPSANIGLAVGDAHVVLDIDPRNGGDLAHLVKLGLDPTLTATQRTWRDGWHVIYAKPPSMDFDAHVAGLSGLDVLTGARYIVAAPSVIDGKPYRWERDLLDFEPTRIPLHVAERLQKRTRPAAPATASTTTPSTPRGDAPPLHVVEHALAHVDAWHGGYDWWVKMLMALHSAYPGDDGLALAEAWAKGKPGEIAKKWASFDPDGGVTIGYLIAQAKAVGWLPSLATDEPATMETAHEILHRNLETHGGDCAICGKSFFETAVVGDEVRGRRRVMMCHRRDCATWLAHKTERQIMQAQAWQWPAWWVSEHTPDEWRRLVNGPLGERSDWLGAPLVNGNRALFAGFRVNSTAVSVSLETMLSMAALRILSIPNGKRLSRPKVAARAKRLAAAGIDVQPSAEPVVEPPAERLKWQRWTFGIDLLDDRSAWEILAIVEHAGGAVTPDGKFRYPLALDGAVRAAVARWMKPERPEISAYRPPAAYASISPAPPLPEQPGYRAMPDRQRKTARTMLLEDTERAYRQRESLARA